MRAFNAAESRLSAAGLRPTSSGFAVGNDAVIRTLLRGLDWQYRRTGRWIKAYVDQGIRGSRHTWIKAYGDQGATDPHRPVTNHAEWRYPGQAGAVPSFAGIQPCPNIVRPHRGVGSTGVLPL